MTQNLAQGFEPIIGKNPNLLILGSMPGVASLNAEQYYGHPRNAFWKIIANIYQVKFTDSYEEKLTLLKHLHIALWDVIAHCERPGSLDSAIKNHSININPVIDLVNKHRTIKKIALNGGKAFEQFEKHIAPHLSNQIQYKQLPSTSPAYTLAFDKKVALWKDFLC